MCVSMRTPGAAHTHTHNSAAAGAINFCALARIQAIILYFPLSTQNNNKAKISLLFLLSKQHFVSLLCAVARLTFYDCFCASRDRLFGCKIANCCRKNKGLGRALSSFRMMCLCATRKENAAFRSLCVWHCYGREE
jgi:hypothetical protein